MTFDEKDPSGDTGPINEEERAELLQRDGVFLVVVLLCLANGMHFSPLYDYVLLPVSILTKSLFGGLPLLVTYVTSILISTVTLMLSGIPAALHERRYGKSETDTRSCVVWLVGAFVLALPTLLSFVGVSV